MQSVDDYLTKQLFIHKNVVRNIPLSLIHDDVLLTVLKFR